MQEIKVLVPDDRVPGFYTWFGAWLSGTEQPAEKAPSPEVKRVEWAATLEDQELAAQLWVKLSERAKSLFGYLIDQPDAKFSGEELSRALGIPNGRYGIAGVLAWPGRYCLAMGRHLPISWSEHEGMYWMRPDVAELFAAARA